MEAKDILSRTPDERTIKRIHDAVELRELPKPDWHQTQILTSFSFIPVSAPALADLVKLVIDAIRPTLVSAVPVDPVTPVFDAVGEWMKDHALSIKGGIVLDDIELVASEFDILSHTYRELGLSVGEIIGEAVATVIAQQAAEAEGVAG